MYNFVGEPFWHNTGILSYIFYLPYLISAEECSSSNDTPKMAISTEEFSSLNGSPEVAISTEECSPSNDTPEVVISTEESSSAQNGIEKNPVPNETTFDSSDVLIRVQKENMLLQEKVDKSEERVKQFEAALYKCYTVSQAQSLISGQPVLKWEDIDIINALSLKSLSTKTYKYLRNYMNMPLPDISTINRRIAEINVEPGLLNSVLRMMAQQSGSYTSGQKACTLSFDEMKIESKYCYDRASDTIYRPHNYVQVVMAQGILYNWRQPLFFGYDTKLTKVLLFDIISKTEKAGYPVHGVVCDMSGSNQGLLKSLGISMTKSHFDHPVYQERSVHVFADPPHMLKLVRNNLLDHGINTSFGFANSQPLYEVIEYQKGDLKLTPKVSRANLEVKGPARQKVKVAAQLMSESMEKAIQYLGEKGVVQAKTSQATHKLIGLVDKWFDIMNSSKVKGDKPLQSAYTASSSQLLVLNEIIDVFEKARCKDKVFPFQTGIVLSSKSLINLFADMVNQYSIKYLLTRRFNQDDLEETFGILRQMGRAYDHPDPISFKYRMRQFILSRKHVLVSLNPNTVAFRRNSFIVEGIKEFKKLSSPIKKRDTEPMDIDVSCENDLTNENWMEKDCIGDLKLDFDDFTMPDEETDGFEYVLGWVAAKYKHKYPWLSSLEKKDNWVGCKDRGGLQHMNNKFSDSFVELEEIFRKRHSDQLCEESQALIRLIKLAEHVQDIPQDVTKFYFRCRIHFRVRELNRQLSLEKTRKKCQKMKKIVN